MKCLLFLLMCMLPVLSHGQKIYEEYYPEGQLYLVGYINEQNGKPEGHWIAYHHNGQKAREGNYKNGLEEGVFIEYDEYGHIACSYTFSKGKLEGPYEQYFFSNSHEGKTLIKARGNYRNNKKHGHECIYDEVGRIINRRWYENGLIMDDTIMAQNGIFYIYGDISDNDNNPVVKFQPYTPQQRAAWKRQALGAGQSKDTHSGRSKKKVRKNKRTKPQQPPSRQQPITPQKQKFKTNNKGAIELTS